MNSEKCILCGDKHPPESMSLINNQGTRVCPRCVFLIALYYKEGVKKKLSPGALMPHRLNARFQKILKEEFYLHPKETYRKYLGDMIDEEENRLGIVRLTAEQFSSVKNEGFPFVFLDEAEAERLCISPGRTLTMQIGEDGSNRFERKVWSSKLLSAKEAKKHGQKGRKVVCFVPKEERG